MANLGRVASAKYRSVAKNSRFLVIIDVKPDIGDIPGFDTFAFKRRSINVATFPTAKRAMKFFTGLGRVMKEVAKDAGIFSQFQWCAAIVDREYDFVVDSGVTGQIADMNIDAPSLLNMPNSKNTSAAEFTALLQSCPFRNKLSRTLLRGETINSFFDYVGIYSGGSKGMPFPVSNESNVFDASVLGGDKFYGKITAPRGYPAHLKKSWSLLIPKLQNELTLFANNTVDRYLEQKVLKEDRSYRSVTIRMAGTKIVSLLDIETNPVACAHFIDQIILKKVDFTNRQEFRTFVVNEAYSWLVANDIDISSETASVLFADARSLYVSRPVTNVEEIIEWAEANGLGELKACDDPLHITQAYSKEPVVWENIHFDEGDIELEASSERRLEVFNGGAVVLTLNSEYLQDRFRHYQAKGCSYDFEEYKPHVTIGYLKEGQDTFDPSRIVPYMGRVALGPERPDLIRD